MRYDYKTQELIDKGVNFNSIYPEKQEVVKQMTGVDFNFAQIVTFLKSQTDNFQKQTPLALDLDRHIYSVYLKWSSKPKETATPSSASSENETVAKLTREINDLKDLIEMETDKKAISKFEKEISDLQELIELEG
ncbi:MAG: hypothetical protein WCI04_00410 [archaeon]